MGGRRGRGVTNTTNPNPPPFNRKLIGMGPSGLGKRLVVGSVNRSMPLGFSLVKSTLIIDLDLPWPQFQSKVMSNLRLPQNECGMKGAGGDGKGGKGGGVKGVIGGLVSRVGGGNGDGDGMKIFEKNLDVFGDGMRYYWCWVTLLLRLMLLLLLLLL